MMLNPSNPVNVTFRSVASESIVKIEELNRLVGKALSELSGSSDKYVPTGMLVSEGEEGGTLVGVAKFSFYDTPKVEEIDFIRSSLDQETLVTWERV